MIALSKNEKFFLWRAVVSPSAFLFFNTIINYLLNRKIIADNLFEIVLVILSPLKAYLEYFKRDEL